MISPRIFLCALFVWVALCRACDLYDTDTAVCAKDLEEICGMNAFPDSIQALHDSRNCLRKSKDLVSKECVDYLELDKPSIVDSCFTEMKTYCMKVVPGAFRIHNCLSGIDESDISPGCQTALTYDQKLIQEKGSIFSSLTDNTNNNPAAFWSTWASYIEQLTKDVVKTKTEFLTTYFVHSKSVPSTYLRGTLYVISHQVAPEEEEGDAEEGDQEGLISTDDDKVFPPFVTDDADDDSAGTQDDDYLKLLKESILASGRSSQEIKEERGVPDLSEKDIATTTTRPEPHPSLNREIFN